MFHINAAEKIKVHFFSENLAVYKIMSKNVVAPEAADGNIAARYMLD